jgi:RNA polymerase primary sigma factor
MRFLRDLKACDRVRHVHQEILLGLHVAAAAQEPPSLGSVADQVRCLQAVVPPDLDSRIRLPAWTSEIAVARTDGIYSCEGSELCDFLRAAEQTEDERLVRLAYAVAEGLAAQPDEVLSELTSGAPLNSRERARISPARSAAQAAQEASKAQEKLVVSYVGYALRTARKYVGRGVPYLDLVHEGVTGIIEAARRYSPRDGRPFKQVATTWAWQRVEKALSDYGRTVRLPANVYKRVRQCDDACDAALREGVTDPAAVDVLLLSEGRLSPSSRLGNRIMEVERLLQFATPAIPIETTPGVGPGTEEPDGDLSLRELLVDKIDPSRSTAPSPLDHLLAALPDREADIIRLYFGIGVNDVLTLAEIGERVGLTRERVRQLKEQALKRLRRLRLADHLPEIDVPGWLIVSPPIPSPSADWRRRHAHAARRQSTSIHRLLSAHLDGYRGYRHNKTRLRHHLVGALREASRPMTAAALTDALNQRLAPSVLAQRGALGESYVQGLLREAPKVFVPLGDLVYGLSSEELCRSTGDQLAVCPPLISGVVDRAVIRRAFSIGCGELGPRAPRSVSAGDRHAAVGVLYLLGLSEPTDWYSRPAPIPALSPPTVREERAWMAGLEALTSRLSAMDVFWSVLRECCPASEDLLTSRFGQRYPLGLADTPHRLSLLRSMGAVEVDEAGRYWLTSRGGACADQWSNSTPAEREVRHPDESTDLPEDQVTDGLTQEDEERLVNTLLGL